MTAIFVVPEWRHQGACRDIDAKAVDGIFFPTPFEQKRLGVGKAGHYCGPCPVRPQCLSWALINDEFGTWGGLTEADRRALRKKTKTVSAYNTPAAALKLVTVVYPKCPGCALHKKLNSTGLCSTCSKERREARRTRAEEKISA